MRARWGGNFALVEQFGELLWQGEVSPAGRPWVMRVPYPLTGALHRYGIDYPRVEILRLPPSPHRIGRYLCLYYPWDSDPRCIWTPERGVSRLIELGCIWLSTYEAWLRCMPGPDEFPAWMFGEKLLRCLSIDESNTPAWPGLEAPHGIPEWARRDAG